MLLFQERRQLQHLKELHQTEMKYQCRVEEYQVLCSTNSHETFVPPNCAAAAALVAKL